MLAIFALAVKNNNFSINLSTVLFFFGFCVETQMASKDLTGSFVRLRDERSGSEVKAQIKPEWVETIEHTQQIFADIERKRTCAKMCQI